MGDVSEGSEDIVWVSWQCHQKGCTTQDRELCLGWMLAFTSLEAAKKQLLQSSSGVCLSRDSPVPAEVRHAGVGEEGAPSPLEERGR